MLLKKKKLQTWARYIHVYVSMGLLLIILFFVITGITLNRPHLFVNTHAEVSEQSLLLPIELFHSEKGLYQPDASKLIKYLKAHTAISGQASALQLFSEIEQGQLVFGEISLDFKGPGYNAAVFVDMFSGETTIEVTDYGVIALLNDLHKGRNSGGVWQLFIDFSALLMLLFVLSGVCLLLPKHKTLITSLKWSCVGTLVTGLIYLIFVP
ncbi:MAG: peptidase [Psychromonas sp.]|nr:peptidase [Alteromonadales bacterium]MCP5078691.1 peptidase [Psychromonas sp.]